MTRQQSRLLLCAVCLAACAPASRPAWAQEAPKPPAPAGMEPALVDRNHHLGPGDTVEVSVSGIPEFSRTVRLFADGTFDYPILGSVQAAGLTVQELAQRLTEGLKKELRRPVVTVTLKGIYVPPPPPKVEKVIPKIVVLGAAGKKGEIALPEPRPLRTLLAEIAPTEKADLSRIRIRYPDGSARTADFGQFNLTGKSDDDLLISGGEEVILLERPPDPQKGTQYVRILGQVASPTQYELKPNMTLEDLILAAGKLTPVADIRQVELRRKGEAARTVDLYEQQKQGPAGQVRLQDGDEVFIPEHRNALVLVGAVPNPGPQALQPGQTLRDFFLDDQKNIGALNPASANIREAELIRKGAPARKLDLRAILRDPKHRANLALEAGDVLFIPPKQQAGQGGALRYIQSLGPLGFLFGLF